MQGRGWMALGDWKIDAGYNKARIPFPRIERGVLAFQKE